METYYILELQGARRTREGLGAGEVADMLLRALREAREADAAVIARGAPPRILALAHRLEQEHATLERPITALAAGFAQPRGMLFPGPLSGVQAIEREQLRTGDTFGSAYARHMVQLHLVVCEGVEMALEQSPDDPQLHAVVKATRSTVLDLLAASRVAVADPDGNMP